MKASEGLARETSEDNFAVRLHDLQMVVDNIDPNYKVTNTLSSKESLFLSVCLKCVKEKHPVLVYCDYTEVVDRLETLLQLKYCRDNRSKTNFKSDSETSLKRKEKK